MAAPERRERSAAYRQLFDAVVETLFRYDPARLGMETNTDEYSPEARTILPRLRGLTSVDEVEQVIRQEFTDWGLVMTIPKADRVALAGEVWKAWIASGLAGPPDIDGP